MILDSFDTCSDSALGPCNVMDNQSEILVVASKVWESKAVPGEARLSQYWCSLRSKDQDPYTDGQTRP